MGRRPLIEERKHPFYFKMAAPQKPAEEVPGEEGSSAARLAKGPEFFMEQVMEGLSDACLLVDGTDRIVYINTSGKTLLRPKGRILGRKLESVLADRQLSMLAADAYHTGKPLFSRLALPLPGERWRDDHEYHISIVPLWITTTRRLVRIALRSVGRDAPDAETAPAPSTPLQCSDTMLQMKNPLAIIQGYLENMLDGMINDPVVLRQSLLTMRKHTVTIERLLDSCQK
jgi:two-component system OmpR family sensor kinase/two-component system phosphate regulon sensor histidine kinase PhoR